MVDYTFYETVYLGSAIPEKAFPGVAAQAAAELGKIKRYCTVKNGGEEAERLALCAMAEAIFESKKHAALRSASVGGVSVSYENKDAARAARRAAEIYLDIYRGVGR